MEEILKELDKPLHSVNINYYFQYNMAWMTEYARKHHYELKDVVLYFVELFPTIQCVLKTQGLSGFINKYNRYHDGFSDDKETETVVELKKRKAIADVGNSDYAIITDLGKYEKTLQQRNTDLKKRKEDLKDSLKVFLKEKASFLVTLPTLSAQNLKILKFSNKQIQTVIKEAELIKAIEKEKDGKYTILDKDELLLKLMSQIEMNLIHFKEIVDIDD